MEEYDAAAMRHYDDAEFLARDGRYDNADHHFGISAECGVKATLLAHGAPFITAATQRLEDRYLTHIDVLWERAKLQQLARHQMYSVLELPNPFSDWSVDQRYTASGSVTSEQIAKHKSAARRVLGAAGLLGTRRGSQQ